MYVRTNNEDTYRYDDYVLWSLLLSYEDGEQGETKANGTAKNVIHIQLERRRSGNEIEKRRRDWIFRK